MSNVYVAGSINMDIVAFAARHPEVGETVAGESLSYFPGGKGANQAVASARMGADTYMVGKLGDDVFAGDLRAFLDASNIDLTHVSEVMDVPSGTALIVVGGGDNTIVVIPGANAELSAEDTSLVPIAAGDVLLAQFETPVPATKAFFERGKAAGATTILNPAPAGQIDAELLGLSDILVVNESEFALITGHPADISAADLGSVRAAVEDSRSFPHQTWVVTRGAAGVAAFDGAPDGVVLRGHEVDAVDSTGAGDCFVGSLAAALAQGLELSTGLVSANAAAALCVQTEGAGPSMPDAATVERFMAAA